MRRAGACSSTAGSVVVANGVCLRSDVQFYKPPLLTKNAAFAAASRAAPMSDESDLAARVTELEVKLSFAEDTVEALNTTVFRQQQQIEALSEALRALREQLQSGHGAEPRALRDEIPPHY